MISSTEVISVNRKDNTIKVKGQNGSPTHTVSVQDPSLQRQIQGLKPGDVVQITYTEAVAARIRPRK
jgi:hypothetical protein